MMKSQIKDEDWKKPPPPLSKRLIDGNHIKNDKNKKQRSWSLYAVIGDCKVGERAIICDASSQKEAITNMLNTYEPPEQETYAVDLDVYNVTRHRKWYEKMTNSAVVTYSLEHDNIKTVHRGMHMIHPVQPVCSGRYKHGHRYAFKDMSHTSDGNNIFKEECIDCLVQKITKTGLETKYGSQYYSIEYKIQEKIADVK